VCDHCILTRVIVAILGLGFACSSHALAGRVWIQYANDFQGSVGPEWSVIRTTTTPLGARTFLGQFGSEAVILTVNNVRPHTVLRVEFDLFIIGSWDGNYARPGAGPDVWDLSVQDGATFLHTTFNTHTFPGCETTDLDGDDDVDLDDLAMLQRCISGTVPADPNCMD